MCVTALWQDKRDDCATSIQCLYRRHATRRSVRRAMHSWLLLFLLSKQIRKCNVELVTHQSSRRTPVQCGRRGIKHTIEAHDCERFFSFLSRPFIDRCSGCACCVFLCFVQGTARRRSSSGSAGGTSGCASTDGRPPRCDTCCAVRGRPRLPSALQHSVLGRNLGAQLRMCHGAY